MKDPRWMLPVGILLVLTVGAAGILTWTAGLWPGPDDPRATVDRCYITYDRQENRLSRCVGNWTRGGHGYRGPIHGFDVPESWPLLSPDPNENYEWAVEVPDSERRPLVLADTSQAWTISPPGIATTMVPAIGGALLVGWLWAATSTLTLITRRRADARRTGPSSEHDGTP